jgi:hypothetical protein
VVLSCGREKSGSAEASRPPWIAKPFAEWPQLVLTNRADFRGHSSLEGASSFLVTNGRGVVVAATARHLIGQAGGVEPPMAARDLDAALVTWKVHPRTLPERAVELGRVAIDHLDDPMRDWLLLTLKDPSSRLPSQPLRLRREPVTVGESVYLVGCSYVDRAAVQNVYKGRVTQRLRSDYWRFDIDPPVELPGFSGAPVLDRDGNVVGVMSVWFEPRKVGTKWLEAGGEDVGAIFQAVEDLK